MPLELPVGWVVILNIGLWPVIQLGLAWGFTRLPVGWFRTPRSPRFETARRYEKFLGIRAWKDLLPDGAGWVGGAFAKNRLDSVEAGYLQRFVAETWRGELCHVCALLFVPLFFLWNPWWGNLVVTTYAVAANLPCIIAQRYNRLRLRHLLCRQQRHRCQEDPPSYC